MGLPAPVPPPAANGAVQTRRGLPCCRARLASSPSPLRPALPCRGAAPPQTGRRRRSARPGCAAAGARGRDGPWAEHWFRRFRLLILEVRFSESKRQFEIKPQNGTTIKNQNGERNRKAKKNGRNSIRWTDLDRRCEEVGGADRQRSRSTPEWDGEAAV